MKKVKKLAIGGGLRMAPAVRPAPAPAVRTAPEVRPAPAPRPSSAIPKPAPVISAAPTAGLGSFFGGPNRASMGGGKPTPMPGITSTPPIPSSGTVPVKTDTGAGKPFSALAGIKKALMKKGGSVKSASARADGIAKKGKTKGRMI